MSMKEADFERFVRALPDAPVGYADDDDDDDALALRVTLNTHPSSEHDIHPWCVVAKRPDGYHVTRYSAQWPRSIKHDTRHFATEACVIAHLQQLLTRGES